MVGPLPALPSGPQSEGRIPLGRRLHAPRHRAAALDGIGGYGSVLRVCGSVVSAAQVVSPRTARACVTGEAGPVHLRQGLEGPSGAQYMFI